MSLASLYTICLDRIYGLVRGGVWNDSTPNPFSDLPSKIVNELMELTQSHDENDSPSSFDVMPLLRSGRLTRLNLCPFDFEADQRILLRNTHTRGCDYMRYLASYSETVVTFYHFMYIIAWNSYLEELHLSIPPHSEVFRKCRKLRILRLYPPPEMFSLDYFPINLSALSSLKNLEVLHIPQMDTDTIVTVLDTCPKIISLGLTDILDSIVRISERMKIKSLLDANFNSHLQLRRCVWGEIRKPIYVECLSYTEYDYIFSRNMKSAIIFCPLVEELIICVIHRFAFRELRNLKRLTLLRIEFRYCIDDHDDFVPDFIELLQGMGPQFKHLSVICDHPVPVDVICDNCPQLQSLEIRGPIFVKDSVEVSRSLRLKRLGLSTRGKPDDEKGFLFLLFNCKDLEELFLKNVKFLDDSLLNQIFKTNPLTKLHMSCIQNCKLTTEGIRMFKQKVSSIKRFYIISTAGYYFEDESILDKDPNCRYKKRLDIRKEEFFYRRLNENRF